MQIENHKEEVPFAHYEELFKKLNPADAAERLSSVKWDGKEFYVNLLGRDFAISHPDYAIRALDEGKIARAFVAADADLLLTKRVVDRCFEKDIPCTKVESMEKLGRACGIDVKAAAAGLLK